MTGQRPSIVTWPRTPVVSVDTGVGVGAAVGAQAPSAAASAVAAARRMAFTVM
jgi:hypothetical protein